MNCSRIFTCSNRPTRIGFLALLSIVILSGLMACTDEAAPKVEKADPGIITPSLQREGDPEKGYDVITNGGYMSCGIPYSAWKRVVQRDDTLPVLSGRSGKNLALPYASTLEKNADGIEIVSNNCLMCHASLFNGELIIGLGNEQRDFTVDPSRFVDLVGTYVSGKKETAAWRKWADRVAAIAPYMITDTVGVNPAPNLTLALIAHRDPDTLTWSNNAIVELPPKSPLPVSVPPWWRVGKKHALFYNAMGRGDHTRYMMMKSLFCADSVNEAEAIDDMFVNVRSYLASLKPPKYPYTIDQALSNRGKSVFETHCSACHGTYGPNSEYPNLLVDLDTVGTDPAYAQHFYDQSDQFMNWFNSSWYGEKSEVRAALGYIAPPLDAVWATAPFLHNGSIPTIEALLDSSKRPVYWKRDADNPEFDALAIGLKYIVLSHGKNDKADPRQQKHIYDTTQFGYSNAGHLFGDKLSTVERKAVMEYLKTI